MKLKFWILIIDDEGGNRCELFTTQEALLLRQRELMHAHAHAAGLGDEAELKAALAALDAAGVSDQVDEAFERAWDAFRGSESADLNWYTVDDQEIEVPDHPAIPALRNLVKWMDDSGLSKTKPGGVGVFAYEGHEFSVVTEARIALNA